ncbi:MAG: MFS transporter [Anaerolineales bacterium]|nr:MFS transporter [Anaerolineales bacterium]
MARLILNTSRRFAYPFASALSRGLGVPLAAITSLIAVNQVTGVLSPVFGPLGDRWGYRVMMLAGLAMLTGGMLVGGLLPAYGVVLLGLFLAGLGKSVFDPALHAYVGERVPYQRRGRAIGMLEFSWAGSALLGIPLIGLLIERLGWRAPFFVLGGLGLLSIVALRALIPSDRHQQRGAKNLPGFREAWRQLSKERAALGALGFGLLISAANDNLFVVYGVWLESSFGLTIAVLGAATTVIGLAELLGEGLTASIADRLGLKRAIATGSILSALSYILLPLMGRTLPLALIGLFITFLTFEFTIVTAISLFTEILPNARATMMSSSVAAISIGRVIGALVGGPVWLAGGMLATGFVSAAVSVLALVLLLWGLRGWRD